VELYDFFSKPFDVTEIKNRVLGAVSKKEGKTHVADTTEYDYQTYSRKMLEVYKIVGKWQRPV